MSIYAAIGYVMGILIFAIFIRRHRHHMIRRHIAKAEAARTQSEKGKIK